MKEGAPALLPLLRSRAQGEILAWIVLHPEQEFSLVEIARSVGVSSPTVMREADRLADAGLIRQVRRGNQRMVRAETDNVDEVAALATDRLGREVAIRRVRPTAWDGATDDAFKTTVTSRPMVTLLPDGDRS